MSYHNIIFDEGVSFGATGGPLFHTSQVILNNSYEKRNIDWDLPLLKWDVSHVVESREKMRYLLSFMRGRKGKGHTFKFKDWSDYTVLRASEYTNPDYGVTPYNEGLFTTITGTTFQLQKKYYDGYSTTYRDITRVKAGTFKLYNNTTLLTETTDYTLNYETGVLTTSATHTHWTGEFYFVARFDTDEASIQMDGPIIASWAKIAIVEVRE